MTKKRKLIVVGNGMAGCRAVEELLDLAPDRYEIEIYGAEPEVNYNRIMLSPVLAGETGFDEIVINGRGWYEENGIALRSGEEVIAIDAASRTIATDKGARSSYDRLLIATGSLPFILPVPGAALDGVIAFRDIADVRRMIATAEGGGRAVVIGGGLLGLEAANGLRTLGMQVSVIHLMDTLMERQLDEAAGFLLRRELEMRGIEVLTGAQTEEIVGTGRVEGVRLKDGRLVPADLVVMAAGIRPNIALAREAGLSCNRGIVVDDFMRSSDPAIYAVGECVEHRGQVYGLVAPIWEMCRAAGAALAEEDGEGYRGSVTSTKLKVTGVDVFSAGDFASGEDREDIVFRDAARGVYKRLVISEDRVIGAVLYGDTQDGSWYFSLLREKENIAERRETLIFGPALAGASQDPNAAVAALPDTSEICGCNGVCKGAIVNAIREKELTTLDGVRAHTKASASCGSCTGLVEKLMALTLGGTYNPAAVQPICTCTDLGHDEVRRLIKAKELKTIPAVMQELEWKTSCGCAKCRPALNYYLVCDWPDEYADDYQSRFVNERVHANIQKDGTYSVVPRMWGGMTSAKELRAIADVVDKFAIPAVKVTGGQRIDMLGIAKEDLPAVWADLGKAGFVSGHAYAKGLRTVKTCVGTDWCRFGTQDSTGLGIRIEKFMWGSWTPAKVKMAVSGCPRNCAEATCKDVGVICVDSGYEIHFAGAAGLDIRGTEKLGIVKTEDEALEHIVALVQMYREQARYLERIYKWAKRIGYDEIRRQIMDDEERRKALFGRFVFSQKFAQVDPWSERVSGKHQHEFRPMAEIGFPRAAE
ncbi:nitrite reductase large subunit NirB [Parvibaculum sp.]|uniref:nitrite reductase large subunit NirB n=1 Tax=Parvibaculum sp. TaxID=2024848 RepID=UPI00272FE37A|nr:nitrite reductase large subunit NirB [Parvibaculum sp.]MDP1627581.1 nitrite reductase large subunit NirB [Parvibaculum sp.]MDP2148760.1 nitrite reductase large subunit NirB [Parvibaculum sp.]MDP3328716.1 nitrite reductase large subunit NirB [Parvibaculum sp.]